MLLVEVQFPIDTTHAHAHRPVNMTCRRLWNHLHQMCLKEDCQRILRTPLFHLLYLQNSLVMMTNYIQRNVVNV